MINHFEINEKKKPARPEDVAGSRWSAQFVVCLDGALRPEAEVQTSQGKSHGHKSQDEAGGEGCPTDQLRTTHDWAARQAEVNRLAIPTHTSHPFLTREELAKEFPLIGRCPLCRDEDATGTRSHGVETRHDFILLLEDLSTADVMRGPDSVPIFVDGNPYLFVPKHRRLRREGIGKLADVRQPHQQESEKQNCCDHCVFLLRIHGSPLFLRF